MSAELKPCPFCGSKAEYAFRDVQFSKWKHHIECTSMTCRVEGPLESSKARAIDVWNTRADEAALPTTSATE